jgi:hypothetical protein
LGCLEQVLLDAWHPDVPSYATATTVNRTAGVPPAQSVWWLSVNIEAADEACCAWFGSQCRWAVPLQPAQEWHLRTKRYLSVALVVTIGCTCCHLSSQSVALVVTCRHDISSSPFCRRTIFNLALSHSAATSFTLLSPSSNKSIVGTFVRKRMLVTTVYGLQLTSSLLLSFL